MIPIRDSAPRTKVPFFAWSLVLANVAVFVHQFFLLDTPAAQASFLATFAVVPADLGAALTGQGPFGDGVLPLVTSMFLHAGVLHLVGNMWFLWIFGDNVESDLGHVRFLLFYLATGMFAAFLHFLTEVGSDVPLVGASGAIAGVMGAYLVRFPSSRVTILLPLLVFWTTFRAPAFVALLFWFGVQLLNGIAADGAGNVAWWAHVGGFLGGVALVLAMTRGRPRPASAPLSQRY